MSSLNRENYQTIRNEQIQNFFDNKRLLDSSKAVRTSATAKTMHRRMKSEGIKSSAKVDWNDNGYDDYIDQTPNLKSRFATNTSKKEQLTIAFANDRI